MPKKVSRADKIVKCDFLLDNYVTMRDIALMRYEIYDDIHLAEIMSRDLPRKPRPWWHWTVFIVACGVLVLAPIAWWLR